MNKNESNEIIVSAPPVEEVTNQDQATIASINWGDEKKATWNGYYTSVILVRHAFETAKALKFVVNLPIKQRVAMVLDCLKSDSESLKTLEFTSTPHKGAGRCIGQFLNPLRDELLEVIKSEAPEWDAVDAAFSNWVARFPRREVAVENADRKVRTIQRSEIVVKATTELLAVLEKHAKSMTVQDKVRLLRDLNKATSGALKEIAKANKKAVAEAEAEDEEAGETPAEDGTEAPSEDGKE